MNQDNNDFLNEFLKIGMPIYIILITIWAATAHTISRVRKGEIPHFSIKEWVGDIVISSFVGVAIYYLCKHHELAENLTVFIVAISAHLGTRLISVFETHCVTFYEKYFRGK